LKIQRTELYVKQKSDPRSFLEKQKIEYFPPQAVFIRVGQGVRLEACSALKVWLTVSPLKGEGVIIKKSTMEMAVIPVFPPPLGFPTINHKVPETQSKIERKRGSTPSSRSFHLPKGGGLEKINPQIPTQRNIKLPLRSLVISVSFQRGLDEVDIEPNL